MVRARRSEITEESLEYGFRRLLSKRNTSNAIDVYVYAPDGSRFRSRVELRQYLKTYDGMKPDVDAAFKKPKSESKAKKGVKNVQLIYKGDTTYQLENLHRGKKLTTKQADKLADEAGLRVAIVQLEMLDASKLISNAPDQQGNAAVSVSEAIERVSFKHVFDACVAQALKDSSEREFSLIEAGIVTQEQIDALVAERSLSDADSANGAGSLGVESSQVLVDDCQLATEEVPNIQNVASEEIVESKEERKDIAHGGQSASKPDVPQKKFRLPSNGPSVCNFKYDSPLEIKEVTDAGSESANEAKRIKIAGKAAAKELSASDLLTSYLENQKYLQIKGKNAAIAKNVREEKAKGGKMARSASRGRDKNTGGSVAKRPRTLGCRPTKAVRTDGARLELERAKPGSAGLKQKSSVAAVQPVRKNDESRGSEKEAKQEVNGTSGSEEERPGKQHFLDLSVQEAPKSPYGLIYESLATQPWKVIVASFLISRLNAVKGNCLVHKFLDAFPSLQEMTNVAALKTFFTGRKSVPGAERVALELELIAHALMEKNVSELEKVPCIEKYTMEVFQVFCLGDCNNIQPSSFDLECYVEWRRQQQR